MYFISWIYRIAINHRIFNVFMGGKSSKLSCHFSIDVFFFCFFFVISYCVIMNDIQLLHDQSLSTYGVEDSIKVRQHSVIYLVAQVCLCDKMPDEEKCLFCPVSMKRRNGFFSLKQGKKKILFWNPLTKLYNNECGLNSNKINLNSVPSSCRNISDLPAQCTSQVTVVLFHVSMLLIILSWCISRRRQPRDWAWVLSNLLQWTDCPFQGQVYSTFLPQKVGLQGMNG